QHRPGGETGRERAPYDLLPLGHEQALRRFGALPQVGVGQPDVVGQPRVGGVGDVHGRGGHQVYGDSPSATLASSAARCAWVDRNSPGPYETRATPSPARLAVEGPFGNAITFTGPPMPATSSAI